MDLETRAVGLDHDALRLWLRLLTCSKLIESEVRKRLFATFNVTLPRFDLMAQLYREPFGLTMGDLSRRMMVTGGNVTGIVTQLEEEGLLARHAVIADRRAIRVELTMVGKKDFARMAAVHEGWIEDLMKAFDPPEREALFAMLGDLKSAINEDLA